MAKDFLENSDNEKDSGDKNKKKKQSDNTEKASSDKQTENNAESEDNNNKKEEILPRKRKIVKNFQLPVTCAIVLVAILSIFLWKSFFDQTITGEWYYISEGEYIETYDSPTATPDGVEERTNQYSQRVSYEFTDDGECIVTLGTMSIAGTYSLYTTESSNVFSAAVYYQYTVFLYGSYSYEVKGNIFTGKKLIITDLSTGEVLELEQGTGESPLTPYEDAKLDERLTGEWYDQDYDMDYEFTDDGRMILTTSGGLSVEHVYTVLEDGILLVKYYADTEQAYTYSYSFDSDGKLTFNGSVLQKIN